MGLVGGQGMRIAVCDDEEVQRKLITKYLQEWARERSQLAETVPFPSGEKFLFSWEDDKFFDLLILDIEMDKLSGMELAKKVREENEEIPILFITGYETYMAQGYEVSAIQYLLKPTSREKLFAVMDKLAKGKKAEEKLTFSMDEGLLLLAPSEIWYVEAAGHYCMLHTSCRQYHLHHSLTEMIKILGKLMEFVQCHRSYLVNLKHISAITRTEIVMDDQEARIPISRSAYKAVNETFIKNYGLCENKKT